MAEGFIKIHRGMVRDSLNPRDNPLYFSRYADLVLMARYKAGFADVNNFKIYLERGQIATTQRSLATNWNITHAKLKTTLKVFHRKGLLTLNTNPHRTIITICNYDDYVGDENDVNPQNAHTNGKSNPQNAHTNGKSDPIKKKEERKEERLKERTTKGIFEKLISENNLPNLEGLKQPSLKKQLEYQRIYSDDFILKILKAISYYISSTGKTYKDLGRVFTKWAKDEAKKIPEQAKPAKVEPKQGVLKAETFVEKAEEIFYQGIEKLKGERPSAKINPKNMQNHFVPLLDWLRTVSAKKNRKAVSAIKDETVLKGLAKLISIIPQSRRSWDDLHIWRINPNRQAILEEGLEEEELSGPTYAGMPIEKAKEKRRLLKAYADQRSRDWELQRQGKLV